MAKSALLKHSYVDDRCSLNPGTSQKDTMWDKCASDLSCRGSPCLSCVCLESFYHQGIFIEKIKIAVSEVIFTSFTYEWQDISYLIWAPHITIKQTPTLPWLVTQTEHIRVLYFMCMYVNLNFLLSDLPAKLCKNIFYDL